MDQPAGIQLEPAPPVAQLIWLNSWFSGFLGDVGDDPTASAAILAVVVHEDGDIGVVLNCPLLF